MTLHGSLPARRPAVTVKCLLVGLLLTLAPSCATKSGAGVSRTPGVAALERAKVSWIAMGQTGGDSPLHTRHRAAYKDAVAEVLQALERQSGRWQDTEVQSLSSGGTPVLRLAQGTPASYQTWDPRGFEEVEISRPRMHGDSHGMLRDGIGVPLSAVRQPNEAHSDFKFLPPRGQLLPTTAVIEFPENDLPVLKFYDPREVTTVKVGRAQRPLAADYLTPTHESLQRRGFLRMALGGLIRPEAFAKNRGLFMLEPYRPDKIPVVFVHGLMSDPHIWEKQVGAIMADPELGKRVQCWYFIYPTGNPIASSSMNLRRGLRKASNDNDPEQDDPGFRNMLVIGHSMGGLLTRLQVSTSGDRFWKSLFKVPPDQLPLPEAVRSDLSEALTFGPNPDIKRTVFICTPHRGSKVADGRLGKLGAALIRLPADLATLAVQIVTLDAAFLNDDLQGTEVLRIKSIENLSPSDPFYTALEGSPIHVPYHSIIGRRSPRGTLEESSDGVVPYRSSHLNNAASELVVPHWHGCCLAPETVDEVHRITRLHVLGKGAKK